MKEVIFGYQNNNIDDRKKQGIFYNTEFGRWEYYGKTPIIRAGEQQPSFVSASHDKCMAYQMRVEGAK